MNGAERGVPKVLIRLHPPVTATVQDPTGRVFQRQSIRVSEFLSNIVR